MKLLALPAFTDNYIWLLHDEREALVVDPGEATQVLAALAQNGLRLQGILVTHHHMDHVGGVAELVARTGAAVWGTGHEPLPVPHRALHEGAVVQALGLAFQVLFVPGHTAGHVAYFTPGIELQSSPQGSASAPLLFCGDTLFSGGCGRLFEGTPAQMLASLDRLAALPDDTLVCCTHEYTLANLRFARAVEPHNAELAAYTAWCQARREADQPTLPARLALERRINPFLRSRQPAVAAAVRASTHWAEAGTETTAAAPGTPAAEVAIFKALRQWKNGFQ